MSHEKSERIGRTFEEEVQDKAVDDIVGTIVQIRELGVNNVQRGVKILRKFPVNRSMPVEEREEEIERNNRLYYAVLHDPRLAEQGIQPDMETMVGAEIPMAKDGWYQMSSIRLGDEASLVRMTIHDDEDEPTEFRAQLWYPAASSEEWMFDKVQKQS